MKKTIEYKNHTITIDVNIGGHKKVIDNYHDRFAENFVELLDIYTLYIDDIKIDTMIGNLFDAKTGRCVDELTKTAEAKIDHGWKTQESLNSGEALIKLGFK